MKKVFAILLILMMIFTFTACDSDEKDSSEKEDSSATTSADKTEEGDDITAPESLGVEKEEWDAAIKNENFENVTFGYNVKFISGYEDEDTSVGTYKLTKDGMLADDELITDKDTVTAARTMFLDTTLAVTTEFDKFEYDKVNECYTSKEDIVFETNIWHYKATIKAENVVVVLDSDNNLAKITCKMTQDISSGEDSFTYVLNAEFTFSDYGTTTLEK